MKIAIATPILYNPQSPFNHLFKDIIGGLLNDGNKVVRFVAVKDKKETAYKYGYEGENIEYRLYKRSDSNHGNIISRYIKDTLTNIREAIGIFKLKDVDVLFEDASYSSFWVVKAAKIKGIKIVVMLQDVWPDNAVQSHLISEKSLLYKYFEMWQQYVYRAADKLICISDDMKNFIVSKGVQADKINVIYNWGYSDEMVNISWEENKFVKKFNLQKQKFYAVYAGNIGKMQNVEVIVNAAKKLQNREDIQFLIIGNGSRKDVIQEMVANMKNVTMLPMQSSEIATHIYSAAGVNIISLVEGGTKTAMPSKTGVVLSCGKPTIFTFGNGTAFSHLIKSSGCGLSVDANDSEGLANAVEEFSRKSKVNRYNSNVFTMLFSRTSNIQKYVSVISYND